MSFRHCQILLRLAGRGAALALLTYSVAACDVDADRDTLGTLSQAVQTVCGGDDYVIGIDVSQYQGTIDWDALAASGDADWAYMRVGHSTGTDTQFYRNWPEARRVGMRRGAYQYFRPGQDALEQAEHYLDVIDEWGGYLADDLPPMIDVEAHDDQSPEDIVASVRIWVDYVEAETGIRPVIYTGSYFWDDNVGLDDFSAYHLWTAHYTSADCALTSSSWDHWTIWQYTSTGSVTGIAGNVDTNRFNGTLEDLDLWPECSRFDPISDCLAPDWWCGPLEALADSQILLRSCDDARSDDTLLRWEWAEVLSNYLNLRETTAYANCRLGYTDVSEADGFARGVATLSSLDYGDGVSAFSATGDAPRFEPNANLTRCEAANTVAEALNVPADETYQLMFSDRAQIPSFCAAAIRNLVSADVVPSSTGAFDANAPISLGETALWLSNGIVQLGRNTPSAADFSDPSCAGPDTCTDQCELGEGACDGSGLLTCETAANDCTEWSQPTSCQDGASCVDAVCAVSPESCTGSCALGAVSCNGDVASECRATDGCNEWAVIEACALGCQDEACPVADVDNPLPRFAIVPEGFESNGCQVSRSFPSPIPLSWLLFAALLFRRRQR